jgi:hypothetical protein
MMEQCSPGIQITRPALALMWLLLSTRPWLHYYSEPVPTESFGLPRTGRGELRSDLGNHLVCFADGHPAKYIALYKTYRIDRKAKATDLPSYVVVPRQFDQTFVKAVDLLLREPIGFPLHGNFPYPRRKEHLECQRGRHICVETSDM